MPNPHHPTWSFTQSPIIHSIGDVSKPLLFYKHGIVGVVSDYKNRKQDLLIGMRCVISRVYNTRFTIAIDYYCYYY